MSAISPARLSARGGSRALSHQLQRQRPRSQDCFTEGFRTAALCRRAGLGAGPASESLVRRKPREGRGAVWLGWIYGDFGVAGGLSMWRWGLRAAGVVVRSEHDALFR